MNTRLDAGPLKEWLISIRRYLDFSDIAECSDVDESLIRRIVNGEKGGIEFITAEKIFMAFEEPMVIFYPLIDTRCPRCMLDVKVDERHLCPICQGKIDVEEMLRRALVCPECGQRKVHGTLTCVACRRTDRSHPLAPEAFVCECGGPKQARSKRCLECHKRDRHRVGVTSSYYRGKKGLSDEEIRNAYELYWDEELSLNEVAERILPHSGYANVTSASNSLFRMWRRRGWKLRSRPESLALAKRKFDLARGMRQCTHVNKSGARCERLTARPDGVCAQHDSQRVEKTLRRLRGYPKRARPEKQSERVPA